MNFYNLRIFANFETARKLQHFVLLKTHINASTYTFCVLCK